MNIELLINGAADLGVDLSENEVLLYQKYLDLLLDWNAKVNLTAITDPDEIISKHFLDSIAILRYLPESKSIDLLDIGTGAGFPGVPLKITEEKINAVLLDSINKRVSFLGNLISELNLENISALHGRAEDLGQDFKYREGFDLVVSRAVAKLSVLAELCLPFVKVGGLFVAYKGPKAEEEIREAENAFRLLNGRINRIEKIVLPGANDDRWLIFVKKTAQTPDKYPRKAGIPEKRPL